MTPGRVPMPKAVCRCLIPEKGMVALLAGMTSRGLGAKGVKHVGHRPQVAIYVYFDKADSGSDMDERCSTRALSAAYKQVMVPIYQALQLLIQPRQIMQPETNSKKVTPLAAARSLESSTTSPVRTLAFKVWVFELVSIDYCQE